RYDYNATVVQALSDLEPAAVRSLLDSAYKRLRVSFSDLEQAMAGPEFELEIEARYVGQFHELTIPVHEAGFLNLENGRVLESFHQAHIGAYGFAQASNPVEIVNLRVTGVGVLKGQTAPSDDGGQMCLAPTAARPIWTNGATDWHMAQSYVLADTSSQK